ncbi:hypothetical protein ACWDKQ_19705 [Saccharopolyspora sp. NPDC000995]
MWRNRAVGSRVTPGKGATWPCVRVSVIRAVAIDAGFIGGPYQTRRPSTGWR